MLNPQTQKWQNLRQFIRLCSSTQSVHWWSSTPKTWKQCNGIHNSIKLHITQHVSFICCLFPTKKTCYKVLNTCICYPTWTTTLRGALIKDNLEKVAMGKVCWACPVHCGNHQRYKRHSVEGVVREDREAAETGEGKKRETAWNRGLKCRETE